MLTNAQLVDEYYIENRNRVLEVAAFLDRLDRADSLTTDFRVEALKEALNILTSPGGGKTTRIHDLLSDPTTEPRPVLDRKSARGAYQTEAA